MPARVPNAALNQLRENAGLSQQELADALNNHAAQRHDQHPQITRKTISRWERGEVVWPQPFYRRLLAEYFDVAADELGFRKTGQPASPVVGVPTEPLMFPVAADQPDPRVEADQATWRATRAALGRNRQSLACLAEGLYPDFRVPGLEHSGVIAAPDWLPQKPIPLDRISLVLDPDAPQSAVSGTENATALLRPLLSSERRFRSYHAAVRDLAAPRLFENRLCFRTVALDWSVPTLRMSFGQMGFFDAIDTNEALAHEFATQHLTGETLVPRASWRRLPFRKLIGNPFDLTRRPVMGAVGTLTIRGGESPCVVLHQRDSDKVAGGGGMIHLLPAGIFQPSSVIPEAIAEDFSLWRNIQREYAEELLGHDEYDGSGKPIRYGQLEPFATMDQALADGRIRVWCLGLTLDALTLACDILTVAVFQPELYDQLFADAVDSNTEGTVPSRALPFEENTLTWLRDSQRLSPGAAAALELAWRHRIDLLR
ncbi:helix-turn-helix transcriptional regulator [Actinokineospora enzanensis]|uniref:helix-turn-helix transcriptional regulator n=1 Tax=Actinokineospora enzanensis TaxID=155975 RepID=UPI0003A331C9|nr:helix-turn-helix transcriptional regulator [Actinokineospora enzanensis]